MGRWVVFIEIILIVVDTFVPENFNFSCESLLCNQWKCIYHYLDFFCQMERVEQTLEVELYVFKVFLGCNWTSSIKAFQIGTIWWPLMKILPVSDSAAETTTFRKVLHSVIIVPLGLASEGLVGLVGWSLFFLPLIRIPWPDSLLIIGWY